MNLKYNWIFQKKKLKNFKKDYKIMNKIKKDLKL